jgi:signal transduction histidine kinase
MSYFARIGGKYAITLRAWLILAPLSVLGTVSFTPEGSQGITQIFIGWLIGALAHLVTGIVLLVAHASYLHPRPRKPRPLAAIATLAVAGLLRGLTVAYLFETFGVVAQSDYPQRATAGMVLVVILFGSAAILMDAQYSYREERARLEAEIAALDDLAREGERALADHRERMLDQIRGTLRDALAGANSREQLHGSVDEVVRPLSHRIARSEIELRLGERELNPSRVKLGPALRTGFATYPFNPLATLLIAAPATTFSRFWAFGPIAILDVAVMIALVSLAFVRLRRLSLRGWFAFGAILLVGVASSAATLLLVGANPVTDVFGLLLLSVNVSLPAVSVAAFKGFEARRELNLAELRQVAELANWQQAVLRQRAWVEQQRLGRYLHSEIQGRIRATALRAARQEPEAHAIDPAVVADLAEQCEQALLLSAEPPNLAGFIADTTELWRGAMALEFELDPAAEAALGRDPFATAAVIEIAREAIGNSAKHGQAKRVRVEIRPAAAANQTAEAIELVVTDDGSGAAPAAETQAAKGLGTGVIAELALEWSLATGDGGAVLSATVATAAAGTQALAAAS